MNRRIIKPNRNISVRGAGIRSGGKSITRSAEKRSAPTVSTIAITHRCEEDLRCQLSARNRWTSAARSFL